MDISWDQDIHFRRNREIFMQTILKYINTIFIYVFLEIDPLFYIQIFYELYSS